MQKQGCLRKWREREEIRGSQAGEVNNDVVKKKDKHSEPEIGELFESTSRIDRFIDMPSRNSLVFRAGLSSPYEDTRGVVRVQHAGVAHADRSIGHVSRLTCNFIE